MRVEIADDARPGLGRCLVATTNILCGETILSEAPALVTHPEGDELIDAPKAVLRAYCSAPNAVQQIVLESLATIEYDLLCSTAKKAYEDAVAIANSNAWATGHEAASLQSAIMAFRLNGHSFGGGRSAALFPLMCKAQHSCAPNALYQPMGDEGRYVALRCISKGEEVCMNYLGAEAIMGHRMRRSLLAMQKLFLCRCERCCSADWSSQVPCPGCHPRSADGLLPADVLDGGEDDDDEDEGRSFRGRVRYVVSTAGGSETSCADEGRCWRCHSGCDRSYVSTDVFPIESPEDASADDATSNDDNGEANNQGAGAARGGALGRRLETRISTLVCTLEAAVKAEGGTSYGAILEAVSAAVHTLGCMHWATAKITDVQSEFLAAQIALPAAQRVIDVPEVDEVLSLLAENVHRIWAFCAHSRNPPYQFSTIHKALGVFSRCGVRIPTRILVRGLASCPGRLLSPSSGVDSDEDFSLCDPQATAIMQRLGRPPTAKGVAAVLAEAAHEALHTGRFGEALMLSRHAHLHDPKSEAIRRSLEAATKGLPTV